MNNHMIMGAPTPTSTSSDLQLCPPSPDTHEIFRRTLEASGNIQPITTISPHHPNPRKKRTKMIRLHNTKATGIVSSGGSGSLGNHSGVIKKKKPDPNAPKITRPCTECGKQFWSWKALFGHMRCHPERSWRGINPPPNLHHPPPDHHDDFTRMTTKEDEYAVTCLLMLANSPSCSENIPTINTTTTDTSISNPCHSGSQGTLAVQPFRFDLNFPAPIQDDSTCSSSDLDLRLHLHQL